MRFEHGDGISQKPVDIRSVDADADFTTQVTNERLGVDPTDDYLLGAETTAMWNCVEGLPETINEMKSETSAAVARSRRLRPRGHGRRCMMCVGHNGGRIRMRHRPWQTRRMQSSQSAQFIFVPKRKPNGAAGLGLAGNYFASRRRWTNKIFGKLLSWILHKRECRGIGMAWSTLDDRTLKDIGTTRFEIEYITLGQGWS
jgi:uncharacterized protein YjiS (DUF1127 family)